MNIIGYKILLLVFPSLSTHLLVLPIYFTEMNVCVVEMLSRDWRLRLLVEQQRLLVYSFCDLVITCYVYCQVFKLVGSFYHIVLWLEVKPVRLVTPPPAPETLYKDKVDTTKGFIVNVVDSIGYCSFQVLSSGATIITVMYCMDEMHRQLWKKKQASFVNKTGSLVSADNTKPNMAKINKQKLSGLRKWRTLAPLIFLELSTSQEQHIHLIYFLNDRTESTSRESGFFREWFKALWIIGKDVSLQKEVIFNEGVMFTPFQNSKVV